MVLHNSKWDKKATRRYNKKHGIEHPRPERPQQDEWKARKKLQGNMWRFQQGDEDEEAKREVNELLEGDSDGVDHDNEDDQETEGVEEGEKGGEDEEDHTLRQAALQQVADRPKELPADYYLPPDTYEEDEEQQHIIRQHRATGAIAKPTKMLAHDDPEEFTRIQEDIDRHKFYDNVKKRFAGSTQNKVHDEDDIDKFLDDIDQLDDDNDRGNQLNSGVKGVAVDPEKSKFLDDLLG